MTFGLEQAQAAIKDWPAPWVLELGLEVEECRPGFIRARQPFNARMTRVVGAMSGQAIMAAIDTVMVIAVQTVLDGPDDRFDGDAVHELSPSDWRCRRHI